MGTMYDYDISFTFEVIEGEGHYQTYVPGRLEGGGNSSITVTDRLTISASANNDVMGGPTVYASFKLYINTLHRFCVGASLSRGNRDDRPSNSLSLCGNGKCIILFSVSPSGELGGTWENHKCLEMGFVIVEGNKFLVVSDGDTTKWLDANGMPDSGLWLEGRVTADPNYPHSSCSTNLYIKNLEPTELNINVFFQNTGNITHTFKVGVSIGIASIGKWYDRGYYTDGLGDYGQITLSPGQSGIVTRKMIHMSDATDVYATVKKQDLTILDEMLRYNIL